MATLFQLALIAVVVLGTVSATTNLFGNPSFEADVVSPPSASASSLSAWTISGPVTLIVHGASGYVAAGKQAVRIDNVNDYIQQSIATTVGVEYTLSFQARAVTANAGLRLTIDSTNYDYTLDAGNTFTRVELQYTAAATTTTIRFTSTTNSNQPIVDNVMSFIHKHRYLPADFRREYQQVVPLVSGTNRHDVRFDGWNYGQSASVGDFTQFTANDQVTCKSPALAFGEPGACAYVDATSAYPDATTGTAIKYQFRQNWNYGWWNGTFIVPNGNGVIARIEYYSTVTTSTTVLISGVQVGGTEAHTYSFWFLMDDIRNEDIVTMVFEAGADNTQDLVSVDASFTMPCDDLCTCFFCTPTYTTFCGAIVETPLPTPAQWREDICNNMADQCSLLDCTAADDACASDGGIFCTLSQQCLDLTTACWGLVEQCLLDLDNCPGI